MNENLQKLKDSMDKIVSDRDTNIESLNTQIEKARADSAKASQDMNAATDTEDVKKYSKAKADKAAAEDRITMYTLKLNKLENSMLVSDQERDSFFEAVRAEQNKALEELTAIVRDAVLSISDAYTRLNPVITDGDNLLYEYHDKVKQFGRVIGTKGNGEDFIKYEVPAAVRTSSGFLFSNPTKFQEMNAYLEKILKESGYKLCTGQTYDMNNSKPLSVFS